MTFRLEDGGYATYTAIHRKVLIVAVQSHGQWCAYCTPVAGENHEEEWRGWKRDGTKLSKEVATVMFPRVEPGLAYRN